MRRALISVSAKEGIVDFARELIQLGFEIISTGGTAAFLSRASIPVTEVSTVTGFPEILEGRVKTLHPKIHGGILARRTEAHLQVLAEHHISPIDLVVVNLYPFRETVANPAAGWEEAVENIDIGGPTLIRAAAKNHQYVTVIVNPNRYREVMAQLKSYGAVSEALRRELAREAFQHTALYDAAIAAYFARHGSQPGDLPREFMLEGELVQELRYGENPHQKAAWYRHGAGGGAGVKQLQGLELSFNNLVDLQAAWALVQEFAQPAVAIIKHTNPCGVAIDDTLAAAYEKALAADPVSAFGGLVACNRPVDKDTAEKMTGIFLEGVIAPGFSEEAVEIFRSKPKLRLVVCEGMGGGMNLEVKQVFNGFLVQERDDETVSPEAWQWVAGEPQAVSDLWFAWQVVKHVKSNAIVVAKDGRTLGIGAGQMNRVGAAEIALKQAGEQARGAVLASDAFFPFRDTVDLAARCGIKAIVQPGGSVKDHESIAACQEHGIAMAFTGRRHFKH
ncbi:MAG TPA: bifunctional phosphoribosylaminoimidazolecarboxamide formyltransferase/IMP cyclohydrolase [Clostridia bacterium]|nr:bifunctional phosphoribosylaminoimidazolecarboxamide formyltransferase/IMP cyclohydrolase [Clostridia bacterium]